MFNIIHYCYIALSDTYITCYIQRDDGYVAHNSEVTKHQLYVTTASAGHRPSFFLCFREMRNKRNS